MFCLLEARLLLIDLVIKASDYEMFYMTGKIEVRLTTGMHFVQQVLLNWLLKLLKHHSKL